MTQSRNHLPVPMDGPVYAPVDIRDVSVPQKVERACPRELVNDLYDLHELLINTIQNDSGKNGLRCFMYNITCENYFQTNEYISILGTGLELITIDPNMQLNDAASLAMGDFMAQCIERFPAIENQLDDRTYSDLNVLFNISADVNDILNSQQQPQQRGYGQQQQQRHQSSSQSRMQPSGGRMGRQQQVERPTKRPSLTSGIAGNNGRADTSATRPRTASSMINNRGKQNDGGRNSRPSLVVSNKGGDMEHIDLECRHEIQRDTMRRRVDIAAVESKYPIAHTIATVCVYDGENYKLIPSEEHMNYQDLETVTSMVKMHRALTADMSKPVLWNSITTMPEISIRDPESKEEFLKTFSQSTGEAVMPFRLAEAIAVKSRKELNVELNKNLLTNGVSVEALEDRALECSAIIHSQIIADEKDVAWLEEVRAALANPNLGMFQLLDLIQNNRNTVSIGVITRVNDSIIATVNRRLKQGLGLAKTHIEEVADFDDLIAILRKRFNDSVVDRFKNNVLMYVKMDLIMNQNDDDMMYSISESCSHTYLPWLASDMGLFVHADQPSALVSNEMEPVMRDSAVVAFKEVLKRNVHAGRCYILTEDGIEFEIARSDIGVDNMVVITDIK